MAWQCAECGEAEAKVVHVVCHHCGKLLCSVDRKQIFTDVFEADDQDLNFAYHCEECYDRHHAAEFDAEQPA